MNSETQTERLWITHHLFCIYFWLMKPFTFAQSSSTNRSMGHSGNVTVCSEWVLLLHRSMWSTAQKKGSFCLLSVGLYIKALSGQNLPFSFSKTSCFQLDGLICRCALWLRCCLILQHVFVLWFAYGNTSICWIEKIFKLPSPLPNISLIIF